MKKKMFITSVAASGTTPDNTSATWDSSTYAWDDATSAWDGGETYETSDKIPIMKIQKDNVIFNLKG